MQLKKKERIRNIVGKMISRKLQFAVKAFNLRKHLTFDSRVRNTFRYGLWSQIRLFEVKCVQKSGIIVLEFLKRLKQRNLLINCWLNYWNQILKIRGRFLLIILMKRKRLQELKEIWEEEKENLIHAYRNEPKKTKKVKETLK